MDNLLIVFFELLLKFHQLLPEGVIRIVYSYVFLGSFAFWPLSSSLGLLPQVPFPGLSVVGKMASWSAMASLVSSPPRVLTDSDPWCPLFPTVVYCILPNKSVESRPRLFICESSIHNTRDS